MNFPQDIMFFKAATGTHFSMVLDSYFFVKPWVAMIKLEEEIRQREQEELALQERKEAELAASVSKISLNTTMTSTQMSFFKPGL